MATGFESFAFNRDFPVNGLLYTTHTGKNGAAPADFSYADSVWLSLQWIVSEWKTDNPATMLFSGKRIADFVQN